MGQVRFTESAHRRMSPRAGPTVAAGVVVSLMAASCQTIAPPPLKADEVATIQQADRVISSKLTPDEAALLVNAHGAVVEDCMQQRGWDFEVGTTTPQIEQGGPSTLSQLEQWTFADVASAESDGYGLESYLAQLSAFIDTFGGDEGTARIPEPDKMSAEDAGRFELDYFGREEDRIEIVERDGSHTSVPGGGCLAMAERAVYGDIEQELRLQDARSTAQVEIWGATLSDSAVVGALNAWTRCMSDGGLEFENPHSAFEEAVSAAQGGDFEREALIARADAECKVESGLDVAVERAFLSATNAVLPDLEDDLVALQQFEEEALARAKDILRLGEG